MAKRGDEWRGAPLSVRVRAAMSYEDDELVREIRLMEQAAAGEVTGVVRNGRFPKWSFERWLLIGNVVLMTLVWIFRAGGEVTTIRSDIAEVKTMVEAVGVGLGNEIKSRERRDDELANLILATREPNAQTPRSMSFGRDSRFGVATK